MKNQKIIHIGYPKTGTTWYQKIFFPNVKNFNLVERVDVKNYFIEPFETNFNLRKTIDFFNNKYHGNIIISDERLLGGMYSGGYNGFATSAILKRIKLVFPDAKIIIFIRNQVDLIASTYYHYIMYGGTYNIKKYLFPNNYYVIQNIGLFNFEFFNFYKLIKFLKSNFNDVEIFTYEEFESDYNNFLINFCAKNNFEVELSKLTSSKINTRYRKALIPIRKMCNHFTKQQIIYKHYFINIPYLFNVTNNIFKKLNKASFFGKAASSKYLLGKKYLNFIKDYYKETNKKLYVELNDKNITKYYK